MKEKKINKDVLSSVIGGLFSSIISEQDTKFKEIIDQLDFDDKTTHEELYFGFLKDQSDLADSLIRNKITKNKDVAFIYKNSDWIERFYNKLIKEKEGSACSSDKSRTIMTRLVNYYSSGIDMNFDWSGKYTFNMCRKVFTRQNEIITYYEAIRALKYGDFKPMLMALPTVLMGMNNPSVPEKQEK